MGGVAALVLIACSDSSTDPAAGSDGSTSDGGNGSNPISDGGQSGTKDAASASDAAPNRDAGVLVGDGRAPLWVFENGSFNWPPSNDYSYALNSISYTDTSGSPLSGTKDIKIVSAAYGGWQPAAGIPLTPNNWDQDITGMGHFTFALKPSIAGMTWKLFFHKVGDVLVYDSTGNGESVVVNTAKYGPANPPANEWSTYVVPVEDVLTDWDTGGTPGAGPAVLLTHVYKFAIADATGNTQTWYVDNVGFIP